MSNKNSRVPEFEHGFSLPASAKFRGHHTESIQDKYDVPGVPDFSRPGPMPAPGPSGGIDSHSLLKAGKAG